MGNTKVDTDILIVGAGPVGLFLANECARRALRWRLIETRPTQSIHSKALAIFPRTMEIFDMAGVVGPFVGAANRVTSVAVFSQGQALAHMQFTPEESPYSFIAMVPQDVTEKLLAVQLQKRGGVVEYETTFLSAEDQGDSVSVSIERRGQPATLRAAIVVGCDGAHSAVRHSLQVPFDGAEYEDLFVLADIESNETLPADQMQLCPNEFGPAAIFPMSATRRRVVATIDHKEGDTPSLEMVQQILAQRAPKGLEARSLHWSSYFRIHHRRVAYLRAGRMFMAGDAAHIHSPFGGQGMNTGLQDAWNLAWKLDLFLNGQGDHHLLDSYSAERIPVIKSVIETTDRLTRVMGTPSKFAQVLRDTMIPMVSRFAPFQHAFVQKLSELGIDYHGSPIVEGPGKRYFEDSLRGGQGIGRRFLLMAGEGQGDATKAALQQFCESLSAIVELRTTTQPGITLVRPDGYAAFTTPRFESDATLRSLRSLLERQTAPTRPTAAEDRRRSATV